MTIKSLREIIKLENELSAAEKAEQEKAERWLQEQEAGILRRHQEDLAALEEKKKDAQKRAEEEAREKAADLVRKATKQAAFLDGLDDAVLVPHLRSLHKLIGGRTE